MNFPGLLRSFVAFFGLLFLFTGCDPADIDRFLDVTVTQNGNEQYGAPVPDPGSGAGYQPPGNSLIVGSFNIQAFGRSKMGKPEVVNVLVDVARRFDILAVQELRNKEQTVIPEFLNLLNRDGSRYSAAVSRRIGYADQKSGRRYEEQLVYIYDTNRVEIISQPYVANDRYQLMHRPPYVAHFRCRGFPPEQAFSFVLMNVHTDPDDTVAEFAAMQDIIGSTFPNHPGEDDFLLMGDLNDEADSFQNVRWFSNQFTTIPSQWKTNTRLTKSYDNIVFDARRTAEFMNQGGVMNLMQEYRLTQDQALRVSDHMPVWAVFSTREVGPTELTQGQRIVR